MLRLEKIIRAIARLIFKNVKWYVRQHETRHIHIFHRISNSRDFVSKNCLYAPNCLNSVNI